jgi:Bacterial regulatory helix-turn-helix protein, lysR family
MTMDRIDCLRAFVRALEGGSFSAAAAELGIGQPAVSKRIASLESEFGTQLFFRTTPKLHLRLKRIASISWREKFSATSMRRERAPTRYRRNQQAR